MTLTSVGHFSLFPQCKCWPGFQLKDDGKTCVDIDECSSGFPCSQQCINTYGTYKCHCAEGYEIQPNNQNGCRSLSGRELNLLMIQAQLQKWILNFMATSYWMYSLFLCLGSQNPSFGIGILIQWLCTPCLFFSV